MQGRKVNFGIRNEVSGALLRTFPSLSVYLCAVAKEEPCIGRRVQAQPSPCSPLQGLRVGFSPLSSQKRS